jgi:hypothetical protein
MSTIKKDKEKLTTLARSLNRTFDNNREGCLEDEGWNPGAGLVLVFRD